MRRARSFAAMTHSPAAWYPAADSAASAASCSALPAPCPHSAGSTYKPAICPPGKSGSWRASTEPTGWPSRHATRAIAVGSARRPAQMAASSATVGGGVSGKYSR
jgi:hypothetical protein